MTSKIASINSLLSLRTVSSKKSYINSKSFIAKNGPIRKPKLFKANLTVKRAVFGSSLILSKIHTIFFCFSSSSVAFNSANMQVKSLVSWFFLRL